MHFHSSVIVTHVSYEDVVHSVTHMVFNGFCLPLMLFLNNLQFCIHMNVMLNVIVGAILGFVLKSFFFGTFISCELLFKHDNECRNCFGSLNGGSLS